MTKSRGTWYRSLLFWGSAGAAAAVILAVVALVVKDLRWLLLVAWPCSCIAAWLLATSSAPTRADARLLTVLGSLSAGVLLAYLNVYVQPAVDLGSSREQARLEIRDTVVPTTRNGSPALTISFYNAGKVPATNVVHYYTLATSSRIMSQKEATDVQDRALSFLKPGSSGERIDPGQPQDPSFTVPENAGEWKTGELLSMDLPHVLDGSRLLYLVVAFSYRDRTTPEGAFRVSESCVYFIRTLHSGQPCGRNGTSLEKMDSAP